MKNNPCILFKNNYTKQLITYTSPLAIYLSYTINRPFAPQKEEKRSSFFAELTLSTINTK